MLNPSLLAKMFNDSTVPSIAFELCSHYMQCSDSQAHN